MKQSDARIGGKPESPIRKLGSPRFLVGSGYSVLLEQTTALIAESQRVAARTVNAVMTTTYWLIGRHIVEFEQRGNEKAEYGEILLKTLAHDLTMRFGRGYGWRNIFQMRAFYLAHSGILQTPSAISENPQSPSRILSTASRELKGSEIGQTVSGESVIHSAIEGSKISQTLSAELTSTSMPRFLLPWSAYVRLLSVRNEHARKFYETEALRGGWSVRQLDRQIDSQFYERTVLSHNKAAMLRKGGAPLTSDAVTPEEEIKDPFVLEFLGLKDEYSECDLEDALIRHLETFLLELGGDFAFVGRQRRLRIDDEWYRVDLLFFHRRLRCLVVIDLKLGKLTHADAGQMHMYLNYAREHWTHPGENPPVGLILCAHKGASLARYALEGLPNKVMAAEYRTALPDEKKLAAELNKTQALLEKRK